MYEKINKNHNKYNSSKRRSLAKRKSNNSPFSFDYVNNLITNNFINKKDIINSKNVRKGNKNKIFTKKNSKSFFSNKSNKVLNSQLKSKYKIAETKIINDNEINLLEYEQARQKDKRTYCQYYFSL